MALLFLAWNSARQRLSREQDKASFGNCEEASVIKMESRIGRSPSASIGGNRVEVFDFLRLNTRQR